MGSKMKPIGFATPLRGRRPWVGERARRPVACDFRGAVPAKKNRAARARCERKAGSHAQFEACHKIAHSPPHCES